jgi:hypothetical protein
MKKIGLITTMIALIISILSACEKSELPFDKAIEGTYVGTLTAGDGLKGRNFAKTKKEATAEITKTGNGMMEVHLFAIDLDTTFMLNYYEHRDNVMVCFTGNDFENMYGHMLGQGHMDDGMMNDMQNDETEWIHHLSDEHQNDDEHFGGFDTVGHTFSYRIQMMVGPQSNYFQFEGEKQ